MNKKKPGIILLLAILGITAFIVEGALQGEMYYGNVTVGGSSAIAGSTLCAGSGNGTGADQTCISVSPAGFFGGASASDNKLSAYCSSGDTVTFRISGSGCTGVNTLTATCNPGASTTLLLAFSGTCGTTSTAAAAGDAGGGGGGAPGGGVAGPSVGKTTSLDKSGEFATGGLATVGMTQGDKVTVTLAGKEYGITLATLTDKYVVLESNGQYVTLQPGESRGIDVDGDGKADVEVRLKGIEGGKAVLIFRKLGTIGEEAKAPSAEEKEAAPAAEKIIEAVKKPLKGIVLTIAIVVLGLIGYYVYIHRQKK